MQGTIDIETIRSKRWFMGRNRPVSAVHVADSASIGDTEIVLLNVSFTDGEQDKYAIVADEARMGAILEAGFAGNSGSREFAGKCGTFVFLSARTRENGQVEECAGQGDLLGAKPFPGEQSNSSFLVPGHSIFKLYRRLQAGTHPEAEILHHLDCSGTCTSPQLYGECLYKAYSGETYALGILEQLVPNANDAWKQFCKKMDAGEAAALGKATARMHAALKTLPGTDVGNEPPPFDKLEKLLQASHDPLAKQLLESMDSLRGAFARMGAEARGLETGNLAPQRIHGDYHLGQVLIRESVPDTTGDDDSVFKILDFEGEPSRTLAYRRRLRSPAVDIAGMLRSFRYAAATGGRDSAAAEEAFLEEYARTRSIDLENLKAAARPHILAKAVYEACYELEFRPDWFHIPAKALLAH
jgi:maltokinase